MRIHKTDPAALALIAWKSWEEIMEAVEQRQTVREGVRSERRDWFKVQQSVGMEE